MNIEYRSVNEITPYEKNPRLNEAAVDKVAMSIKEYGFKVPIIIDEDGVIVTGHTRLKAAKKLGMDEVPTIMADDLTPEQIKAFRIADNKVGELASWNIDLLLEEIGELQDLDFDIELTGFDLPDVEKMLDSETPSRKDSYKAEPPASPITIRGDVWMLGDHRLMCGDSTSNDVGVLMDGKKASLSFNDPPYGMKKEKDGVANDNLNYDDLLEFNKLWIPLSFKHLTDVGSWYCWGIDEPLMDIYSHILKPMIKDRKITFRNLLTWDKGSGQGQMSEATRMFATADEKCLFVMCGVQGFNNNSEHYFDGWEPIRQYLLSEAKKVGLNSKKVKEICGVEMYGHWFSKSQWVFIPEKHYKALQDYFSREAFGKEYDAIQKEYTDIRDGKVFDKDYNELKQSWYDSRAYFNNTHDNMNNVWRFNRATEEERAHTGGHATPKPQELCVRAIKSSSRRGEIVLDVFGGSGSTLIASEDTGRICYMMELSEGYCDVIVDRYIHFKGSDEDVYLIRDGEKVPFSEAKELVMDGKA